MIENELKLFCSTPNIFSYTSLKEATVSCNKIVRKKKKIGIQETGFSYFHYYDQYYDTLDYYLLTQKMSLRLRQTKTNRKVILKSKCSETKNTLVRNEICWDVLDNEIPFLEDLVKDYIDQSIRFKPKLKVHIDRYNTTIHTKIMSYNLSFDKIYFARPDQKAISPKYEIEIESIDSPLVLDEQINKFVDYLKKYSYIANLQNRYEHGLQLTNNIG